MSPDDMPLTARILDAWEAGLGQSGPSRALALLAAAQPQPTSELLVLPVGARDRRLLELRAVLFGSRLAAVADCPACGELLDVDFEADAVMEPAPRPQIDEVVVEWEGRRLRFRLPNAGDMIALARCHGAGQARDLLLARCSLDGDDAAGALPEAAIAALSEQMAQADPQAEVHLALSCPACGHEWLAMFDVAAYLWAEVDAWARRTLGEVHALARAYGWSEAEILALSPYRRQWYLALAGGIDGAWT